MTEQHQKSETPTVSLILAVYNELGYVESAVKSLLNQQTDGFQLEILVVDGGSDDGSDEVVRRLAAEDDRIRLLINARRKTPYAFNIGLNSARGEYICILGAHCQYAADYIAVCLRELKRTGAVGCSGKVVCCPANSSRQSRLVSFCLSHPFGTSSNSTRTQRQGYVDTIPYPLFIKRALLSVGGYDEQLFRNQDNDMNQRLRAHGHKLYLTEAVEARYFPSSTLRDLARYAFLTGRWNVISFRRNRSSMSLRHFIPFVFVAALAFSSLMALAADLVRPAAQPWLLLPLFVTTIPYVILASALAIEEWVATRDHVALLLPVAWLVLHVSYGCGTAMAILRNSQPPDLRKQFTATTASSRS